MAPSLDKASPSTSFMYGDLVGCSMMIICAMTFIRPSYLELDPETPQIGPHAVIVTYGWNTVFSFWSWKRGRPLYSVLAAIGFISQMVLQNLTRFPPLKGAIVPQFLWLLIVFSCNLGLTITWKLALGTASLMAVGTTAWYCPGSTHLQLDETLSTMVCSAIVFGAFHILCHAKAPLQQEHFTNLARSVLFLLFSYDIATELHQIHLDASYATQGGFHIVKVTLLAGVGLVSMGTLNSEAEKNKGLQKTLQQQVDELHLVDLAQQASETAVAITDDSKCIIWFNPAFFELTERSNLYKQSVVDVLAVSALDAQTITNLFDDSGRQQDEITIGDLTLELEVAPFSRGNNDHRPSQQHQDDICFVVKLKNSTETRARERAEKAAEHEALVTKTMMESMETLTHELRTPLQGIMGIVSMLVQDRNLSSDAIESLNLVLASSSLLLVLINNLLDVRKCNANMMDEFPLVPTSAIASMTDAIGFCQPLATISGVNIELVPGVAENASVLSNSLRLNQVIINLISNAIKYTAGGGTIQVTCSSRSQRQVDKIMDSALAAGERQPPEQTDNKNAKVVVVSVIDSGPGIAPGQEQRLFSKFAMLNSKVRNHPSQSTVGQPTGTGLGLNLCQKFVHLMNGNIWVFNNDSGTGSTFSFYLPMVVDDESLRTSKPQVPLANTHRTDSGRTLPSSRDHRVLLVDDTLINRKVFARMLKRIGVRATKAVDSGRAALKVLREDEYDLVISDIIMPEMDGFELSEAIQKSKDLKKKPVVVGLTADTSERVEVQCRNAGMVDVLHKPLTVDEMTDYFDTVVGGLIQAHEMAIARSLLEVDEDTF